MDKLDRRLIQLKMERQAVKKEMDEASRKRLVKLEEDIQHLEKEYSQLDEIWKTEKASMQGAQHLRSELENAKNAFEMARRVNDLSKMSELQYGRIPELEKQIAQAETAEKQETHLLRNRVTDEEIAEVVSKWTHIPVAKMLEGEREKLLQMKELLHQRVIGQEEAVNVVSDAILRSRAGLSDPHRPVGIFYVFRTYWSRKNRTL